MTDLQTVTNQLGDIRRATRERLAPLTQMQLDWSPPAINGTAEWSLGEVFIHIATDEIYLWELIAPAH